MSPLSDLHLSDAKLDVESTLLGHVETVLTEQIVHGLDLSQTQGNVDALILVVDRVSHGHS